LIGFILSINLGIIAWLGTWSSQWELGICFDKRR